MAYSKGYYILPNDLNAIIQGLQASGVENGVTNELEVVVDSPEDMGVVIKSGKARFGTTTVTKSSETDLALDAAGSKPRKDIIVINSSGVISAQKGSEADADPVGQSGPETKAPEAPSIPANSIILAEIWVANGVSAIYASDITDRRVILSPLLFTPSGTPTTNALLYGQGAGVAPAWKDNWIWAARLLAKGAFWECNHFLPSDMFTSQSGGTGAVDTSQVGMRYGIKTGSTNGSYFQIIKQISGWRTTLGWGQKRYLHFEVAFMDWTNLYAYIQTGRGPWGSANGSTLTDRHIGIKLINDDLYGSVANGTSESTLLLDTLTGNYYADVEIHTDPNIPEVRYFLDGVDKGAITTNIPTGATDVDWSFYAAVRNTEAVDKNVFFSNIVYWEEPS